MMSKIVCDLCNRAFEGVDVFASHYTTCTGPLNAFQLMMATARNNSNARDSLSSNGREQPTTSTRPTTSALATTLEETGASMDQPTTSTSSKTVKRPGTLMDRPSKTTRNDDIHCRVCNVFLKSNAYKMHLRTDQHKNALVAQVARNTNVVLISSETKFPVETYRILSEINDVIVLRDFYNQMKRHIFQIIDLSMSKYTNIKFSLTLYGIYIKQMEDGSTTESVKHFTTAYHSLYDKEAADEILENKIDYLTHSSSEFQEKDSGWAIKSFKYIDLTVVKLEHIPSGGYCKMPDSIKQRNALVNVKNNDIYCFKWCILAYIEYNIIKSANHKKSDWQQRRKKLTETSHYKINNIAAPIITYKQHTLNFTNIEFPINTRGVKLFEKLNPQFSINVYDIDSRKKPERIEGPSIRTNCLKEKHINLLGIYNETEMIMHYAYITSMVTLTKWQYTKSHKSGEFCENCIQWYNSTNTSHEASCGKVLSTFPKDGTYATFSNWHKKLSPPAVIYADIEAVLRTYDRVQNDPSSSSTTKAQKHEACAVSFYVAHKYKPEQNEMWTYEGK
ncbi:hypothetical protein 1 [Drosophila-associated adintovirus 2]|uniref:C2H2-type domain-containing protein n=1 Tax=Drosophila-associated adintovirus 2 TaxID=2744817 RepID=A0A7D4VFN9_9VIRU|nr:hypothetical protein 1 [Drosophila-associated adintovirus 2]